MEGQPVDQGAVAFLASLTERKQVLVWSSGAATRPARKSVRTASIILAPDQLNTGDVLRADDVVLQR